MRRLPLLWLALGLGACQVEDRTPAGSRQDEAAIRRLILTYHRGATDPAGGPAPRELRVVRTDLRQEGDVAAAWVTARWGDGAEGGERDVTELFVLRKGATDWRIVHVSTASRAAPAGAVHP